MRVIIAGGRDFESMEADAEWVDLLHQRHHFSLVIHGGCSGADAFADLWARGREIPVEVHPVPNWAWAMIGRKAGPIRNQYMVERRGADGLIAFPGGRGTEDIIRRARGTGLRAWRPYGLEPER